VFNCPWIAIRTLPSQKHFRCATYLGFKYRQIINQNRKSIDGGQSVSNYMQMPAKAAMLVPKVPQISRLSATNEASSRRCVTPHDVARIKRHTYVCNDAFLWERFVFTGYLGELIKNIGRQLVEGRNRPYLCW